MVATPLDSRRLAVFIIWSVFLLSILGVLEMHQHDFALGTRREGVRYLVRGQRLATILELEKETLQNRRKR